MIKLFRNSHKYGAFSLVEMLMALLVASLLLAALAPVMTKRMNDAININGNINPLNTTTKKEIMFGSTECSEDSLKTDSDGSQYCEGTYTVPSDYTGVIRVTVIGAGGGGGIAPTAGLTEFKEAGSTNTFTVPAMVNRLEATLVSGGAGGGAGGQVTTDILYNKAPGEYTWNVPDIAKNKYAIVTACGGGGGGGGFGQGVTSTVFRSMTNAGDGGNGGYIKQAVALGSAASQNIIIGGGGGGGAPASENANVGLNGTGGAGGGGGADNWYDSGATGGKGGKNGGGGGKAKGAHTYAGFGGERGDTSLNSNGDGQNGVVGSKSLGGTGGGAGNGGEVGWIDFKNSKGEEISHAQGGGGGGGSITGYGGGGGGAACGGSGGGGGGGATIFGTRDNILAIAPGGGGGGGAAIDDAIYSGTTYIGRTSLTDYENDAGDNIRARRHGGGGGGGGGGGTGGGDGGKGGKANLHHASNGGNGLGYNTSEITKIFGDNFCAGGIAYHNYYPEFVRYRQSGETGKQGAMKITYLDYGPGGSGGGGGQIVPIREVKVTPDETLTIKVGSGGSGGQTGRINSDGTITKPGRGGGGQDNTELLLSKLYRGGTLLLTTAYRANAMGTHGGDASGQVYSWDSDPWYGAKGGINTGSTTKLEKITVNGFISMDGRTANNGTTRGNISFAANTVGGDGGGTTIFNLENHCTPGKGGTSTSVNATNAAGYGGCGGGGGFAFGNGGNGSGGYARISWNKYWDTALNNNKGGYKLTNAGTGGGGASGNIMTYSIKVMGGQNIRIRIGKGGQGASIVNNTVVNAKNGGSTIFGDDAIGELKAGGGGAGGNPGIVNNVFANGTGGSISNICHYGSKSFLNNNAYCKKGTKGYSAENNSNANSNAIGAKGASLTNYGTGGEGGISGTNSYLGKNATGFGSGGGGAAIYDLGDNSVNSTSGENKGGNGSNGKIIIEMYDS